MCVKSSFSHGAQSAVPIGPKLTYIPILVGAYGPYQDITPPPHTHLCISFAYIKCFIEYDMFACVFFFLPFLSFFHFKCHHAVVDFVSLSDSSEHESPIALHTKDIFIRAF